MASITRRAEDKGAPPKKGREFHRRPCPSPAQPLGSQLLHLPLSPPAFISWVHKGFLSSLCPVLRFSPGASCQCSLLLFLPLENLPPIKISQLGPRPAWAALLQMSPFNKLFCTSHLLHYLCFWFEKTPQGILFPLTQISHFPFHCCVTKSNFNNSVASQMIVLQDFPVVSYKMYGTNFINRYGD